ncbi:DUF1992 domain-containing protein [Geomicrobium sp. JCM 19039]|uniref:DnaJ family domain-containing protein n=1 Tax=Geomicrobium sp. JCM 19039 TaxID=1460636 RepID=UPI00045F3D75|nr:DUF1992 domain-containing protein [Geomicrobium sp. JCM 19039]GAK10542.1 hypothetical protein JCM19039_165 [Geomicrobium sp. JCM 19039]
MSDKWDRKVESSIRQAKEQEDFQKLKGHGKPLSDEYLKGDTLNGILKNANYVPPWLEFQHEIRDDIKAVIDEQKMLTESQKEQRLTEVNEKIKKYNRMVPVPSLQKMRIFAESMERQYEKWK